ncbi:hypothetical protein [Aneurinibacillus terranovensis]|uniref:hypothetical protein n=1 Tax=Aneurinibacillus terranovensis TaxID=278991 RepID=UPI00048814C1|nr:hypothetical protein [Aneurinibacillus terranovensis]
MFIFSLLSSLTVLTSPVRAEAHERSASFFSYDINHDQMIDYTVEAIGWTSTVKPSVTVEKHDQAVYTQYFYKQGEKNFRITFIQLKNGDVMYFVRNYPGKQSNQITLKITVFDSSTKTAILSSGKWRSIGLPSSSSSSLYIDGTFLHYRIGNVTAFKPLGYTTYDEVINKERPITIKSNGESASYLIPLPAEASYLSDTWGILSGQPLINWEDKTVSGAAAAMEFETTKKLGVDGQYYPTPDSTYNPYTPHSFYRNPANLDGLQALSYFSGENGNLFYDIATHLAYSSVNTQNPEGFWPTYPRSEGWLYKTYKIGYEYMDNRRNADNVTFLLNYAKQTNDPDVKQALKKWDTYQTGYIRKYGIRTGKHGILIPDYTDGTHVSHTSLNHQTANMNYILEAYLFDGDPVKKDLALQLLSGIEETSKRWVMPNHNLYYSLDRKLNPTSSNDYFELTRDDLLTAQDLLLEVRGEKSEVLQYLIDEKNKWIEEQLNVQRAAKGSN